MLILQFNRVNENAVLFLSIKLWKRKITTIGTGGVIIFTREKQVVAKWNIKHEKNTVFQIP